MLSFGVNYDLFPAFLRTGIDRLGLIMAPLVLLFIGMSFRFNWSQIKAIFSILSFKSGCAFLFSGILIWVFNITDPIMVTLAIVFPQSSFSFWPFAHMSTITKMERNSGTSVFDLDLAMNMIAISLPFSSIVIMGICSLSDQIIKIEQFPFLAGAFFFTLPLLHNYVKYLYKKITYNFKLEES